MEKQSPSEDPPRKPQGNRDVTFQPISSDVTSPRSTSAANSRSSTPIKGMDLEACFSEDITDGPPPMYSAAVQMSNKKHGPVMMSRTLSVVSLISNRGTEKIRWTKLQKTTLFCLCLVNFTSYLSYSVIAPFYPQEASLKGMREATSGFVFSVYALTMMAFSPIFGKLVPLVGTKTIFYGGIFFAGAANTMFGLLNMVDDTLLFTVLSFVVRIFEAVGAAAFGTASYTIVLNLYPDHISTVFGIIETCVGIGMSLGPAIGGVLYSAGGFGLPFYILGSCVLTTLPVSWMLMRHITVQSTATRQESYLTLLRVPQVIVVCIILVVGSQSQGFVEPTLEPHMRKEFGAEADIVGVFFLILAATFSISSPIVGWICMKTEQRIPMMVVGLVLMSGTQLFMGPAPFLGIPSNMWMTLVTVALLGSSFAIAYVPTMESIIHAAVAGGMQDDVATYGLVSGLWSSMYSLGEVLGPSIGGVFLDVVGFPWASTIISGVSLCTAMMGIIYWFCAKKTDTESFWYTNGISDSGIGDDASIESEPAGETTALLASSEQQVKYNSL
ncbi:MFS-type transporter SLC18B1-like [Ornithodoros turicata]|uniref:MFS-type transporter SLC18B1-like n=1 Tax=Ornithodoros turicata TaxID=34597 RepID=UPI0031390092